MPAQGGDRLLDLAFSQLALVESERWTLDVKTAMVRSGLGKPRSGVTAADVKAGEDAIADCERRLRECERRICRIQEALGISPTSEMRWTMANTTWRT